VMKDMMKFQDQLYLIPCKGLEITLIPPMEIRW